ncbi:MAG: nitrate reductase [Verrucomicrobiota bacterium]
MIRKRRLLDRVRGKLPPVRSWDGLLTGELAQERGGFGLGRVPERLRPDATTAMVCGYCSTGCSLNVHLREGEAVNLSADGGYPVNLGMACPKGWEALAPLRAPDRARAPMVRYGRGGDLREVSWEEAAGIFCERMRGVQARHGKESVAFLSTGQICTEEMAYLGAFAKFGMGMVHGDGNTRQCMATSVRAYKESFGFDAPPYTYGDFEESDVIVLVGSNLCIAHPIMWQRVLRNGHDPEIIVVDPRKTETAMEATQHYALAPKSDLVLLYGLARLLIEEGWVDEGYVARHTEGYEGFASHVAEFTRERVAAETGLAVGELERFARTIGEGERVSFWWTMGVNQGHEAVRTAQAIINLALMTGNMGRPGTGANSITGQCNAMGSRLFSNTTNLLGGHDFEDAEDREKVAGLLGIDVDCIPDQNSLAYDQIMDGIEGGTIKGLWVIATNTAHSWINQGRARRVLEKLDFLVVQDLYGTTETAAQADLVLPAAGWGEKDGTLINSERRIGLVKKVSRAPGEALADFSIFRLLAEAWGCGEMFREWDSPEAVFGILRRLSEGQPCDFSGVDGYEMIDESGGVQWPYRGEEDEGKERRLFGDGVYHRENGRALFCYEAVREMPELVSEAFPFMLLTGRGTSGQWHTQTRTGKSAVLAKTAPRENYVEVNPEDGERLGLATGGRVRVWSERGEAVVRVFLTATVRPGQVFMPMHYAETNRLTRGEFDPYSRQPSYKACAVALKKT